MSKRYNAVHIMLYIPNAIRIECAAEVVCERK